MDSEAINPARGSEIQISKVRPSSGETAPAKPPAKTQATQQDTVSLSNAGKSALQTADHDDSTSSETSPPGSSGKANTEKQASPEGAVTDSNENREFSLTETHDVVMKIVDTKTKEVVKQIPSEEELRLRNAIRNMVESSTKDPTEF